MKKLSLIAVIIIITVSVHLHIFAGISYLFLFPGKYQIKELNRPDDTVKNITVTSEKRHKFAGQILIGENPLPFGRIMLLQHTKGRFGFLGNSHVSNGNFSFTNIPEGNYIIYVVPEKDYGEFYYPKYLPTYYSKAFALGAASEITVDRNINNFEFRLLSYNQIYYGTKSIKGTVTALDTVTTLPFSIILLNENKIPMDFTKPAGNKFAFKHLPPGIYYLYPEKPGYLTNFHKIVINDDLHTNPEIKFKITDTEIYKMDDEIPSPDTSVTVKNYNKYLEITVENYSGGKIVCDLTDVSGKFVIRTIQTNAKFTVNTINIKGGIYFLRIKSFDNKLLKVTKVFINN